MPDGKNESSIRGQILAGIFSILTILIASGTAPWWWGKLLGSDSQSQKPAQSPSSPQLSSTLSPSLSTTPTLTPPPIKSSNVSSSPSTDVSEFTPIRWSDGLSSLGISKSLGLKFKFRCPSSGEQSNRLWGTDTYTGDSSICEAAVHSGVFSRDQGGVVTIEVRGGRQSFLGSQRFGVLSKGYDSFGYSFAIIP
jgi:LCCL domain